MRFTLILLGSRLYTTFLYLVPKSLETPKWAKKIPKECFRGTVVPWGGCTEKKLYFQKIEIKSPPVLWVQPSNNKSIAENRDLHSVRYYGLIRITI